MIKLFAPIFLLRQAIGVWSKSDRIWDSSKSDGEKENNGSSFDASVASVENAWKVSHFLPSFRSLIAGSFAIRPPPVQSGKLEEKHEEFVGERRKKSTLVKISLLTFPSTRLKYQRPAVEENTRPRGKPIRNESFSNEIRRTFVSRT